MSSDTEITEIIEAGIVLSPFPVASYLIIDNLGKDAYMNIIGGLGALMCGYAGYKIGEESTAIDNPAISAAVGGFAGLALFYNISMIPIFVYDFVKVVTQ